MKDSAAATHLGSVSQGPVVPRKPQNSHQERKPCRHSQVLCGTLSCTPKHTGDGSCVRPLWTAVLGLRTGESALSPLWTFKGGPHNGPPGRAWGLRGQEWWRDFPGRLGSAERKILSFGSSPCSSVCCVACALPPVVAPASRMPEERCQRTSGLCRVRSWTRTLSCARQFWKRTEVTEMQMGGFWFCLCPHGKHMV